MSIIRYGEIFDKAWAQMRDRLPLVAALSLLYCLAGSVLSQVPGLGLFLSGFIHAGYVVCLIQIRDKNEMTFSDFFWAFTDFNRLLQLTLLGLIYYGMVIGGLVLLVVPGIYLLVALSLSSTYFVTRKQDAVESIKASMRLITHHWWSMAGLFILVGMLNIAGAICFLIGLLISLPMSVYIVLVTLDILEKNQPTTISSNTVASDF